MDKCGNHLNYQGKVKPRCNGGKPCQACKDRYVQRALEKIMHSGHDSDPIMLRNIAADALGVMSS
jgi:hypothetical protein